MEDNVQKSGDRLETESVGRLLLQFSVPTVMTLMVNTLYNIVDQIFVGHGVGIVGMAATNVVFPFTTICAALALLIGDGCAAGVSLHLGRREQAKADRLFGTAVTMLIWGGVGIVVVGNLFLRQIIFWFGASETSFASAMAYARVILLGLPFMMINIAFTAMIRADGNPKFTMKCMIVGALINVVLDPVFIFLFQMGVVGAGIATILGQMVSGILCLTCLDFREFIFNGFGGRTRNRWVELARWESPAFVRSLLRP